MDKKNKNMMSRSMGEGSVLFCHAACDIVHHVYIWLFKAF